MHTDSIGNRLSIDSGAINYSYNNLNELLLQSASTNVLTGSIRVPVSGLHGPTKLAEDVGSVSVKLDAGGTLSATMYTNGTWEYVDAGLKGIERSSRWIGSHHHRHGGPPQTAFPMQKP